MGQEEPYIVERLPSHRERILRARLVDEVIDELCRDYDLIIKALDASDTNEGTALSGAHTHQELVQLSQDLEQEMLARLAKHNQRRKGEE